MMTVVSGSKTMALELYSLHIVCMPLDNQDSLEDQNSLSKRPQYSSTYKKWRNLVLISGGAAAALVMGYGVGIEKPDLPIPTGSALRTDRDVIVPLLVKETATGGLSGSGFQILVGITKTDGTILNKSGAYIGGPIANPNFAVSGATMKIGGGFADSTYSFEWLGSASGQVMNAKTLSGANVTISGKYSPSNNRVPCYKAGGVLGYYILTATGQIANVNTCI